MEANHKGSFTGKVAFVTGAANGIGRATALAFARECASVVVADVSEQGNQETVRILSLAEIREILQLYAKGFQVSHDHNLYLGVNAAALQLWQGDTTHSKELSVRIAVTFSKRNSQLTASGIDVGRQRSYFDMVTEAEARLLATEGEAARALYAYAFQRFSASNKGDIEGSKHQANCSIALLGGAPIV